MIMKNKSLITIVLIAISFSSSAQYFSIKSNVSSYFPNTFEEHTRVMYYHDDYALTFIDSLGAPYIIARLPYVYLGLTPTLVHFKMPLPNRLVFSEMKKVNVTPWFCGSQNGNGVYGRISTNIYNLFSPTNVTWAKLSDMNNLKRHEYIRQMLDPYHRRVYAIGETNTPQYRTHIVELEILGINIHENDPYLYATAHEKEYFNDLKLIADHIIYTTRDDRRDNYPVNLRLSQIENVLAGTEIDTQWQFNLDTTMESVIGEVFITRLETGGPFFEVSYIKYNSRIDKYILCMHKIILDDLLNLVCNTIVSQELVIPKGEEILDIKCDETYQVLFVLMQKDDNRSVFYHTSPYKNNNYMAVRLESSAGEKYYSIDTLMASFFSTDPYYVAWGGNKTITQEFTTDGAIHQSCLSSSEEEVTIVEPIKITKKIDRLVRNVGRRDLFYEDHDWTYSLETRDCYLSDGTK